MLGVQEFMSIEVYPLKQSYDVWSNLNNYNCEIDVNFILTSRQTNFMAIGNNRRRVGLNAMANIISILNDRIPLNWFNMSMDTFKVHCKKLFLKS